MNYYNEFDPRAAAWLRELITQGLIPPGYVDERSIEDVKPNELDGFTQCHFFAGIGGWSLSLQLAGWPTARPVWTGSAPCQPFSAAGSRAGFADERHLWPAFYHLIEQCRPPTIFGEQVASRDGLAWLDLVCGDLESANYAVGAADLCAAGVGAPHIRQRLYWTADGRSAAGVLAIERMGHADSQRTGRIRGGIRGEEAGDRGRGRGNDARAPSAAVGAGPLRGFWAGADWVGCRDGKLRPVEPGSFPLAHGLPARVAALRGYGNAIVPEVAAAFIAATM